MTTSPKVIAFRDLAPAVNTVEVVAVNGREARVVLPRGEELTARVAFSCLVRPLPGDQALCLRDEQGRYFLVSITERPGDQDLTLDFPASVDLTAQRIGLSSTDSLHITSGGPLTLVSEREVHRAKDAVINFDQIIATGERAEVSYGAITVMSRLITTLARQAVQKFTGYFRKTEDHDQVDAGQMSRKTDGLYALDTRHTLMRSKGETKIDGEHIFMG